MQVQLMIGRLYVSHRYERITKGYSVISGSQGFRKKNTGGDRASASEVSCVGLNWMCWAELEFAFI